jgi:hypothetical protein
VGDVDLVIQAGVPSSIATFLQRVGRAGHALSRTPKGRLFPLTRDELACAAGLLDAVRRGTMDRTPDTPPAADILAQQIVAACAGGPWATSELHATLTKAWPYRALTRQAFDAVVGLHAEGRLALLHRDGVRGRLRGTVRARLTALTSGGAIPDTADYQVVLEPDETPVGSVHEDFAIEANMGDIFQLGNASWRILKVEQGKVRVADAAGAPPTLPFWIAEGPSRTRELSEAVARVREQGTDSDWLKGVPGLPEGAAAQLSAFLQEGVEALGAAPTQRCVVLERFFDESGGMQLVLHAPFGAGGGVRLPASGHGARRADPGAAGLAAVRGAVALERAAVPHAAALTRRKARAGAHSQDARRRSSGGFLSPGDGLRRDAASRRHAHPLGAPDRGPDHHRLPDRGHGCGGFPRRAAGTARRNHPQGGDRQAGAVPLRCGGAARHALRLPG